MAKRNVLKTILKKSKVKEQIYGKESEVIQNE